MTTADLTSFCIDVLRSNNFTCWKEQNIPFGKRKHNVKKGKSDIIGYSNSGKILACEIKNIGDELSKEQEEFLRDIHQKGGHALVGKRSTHGINIYYFVTGEPLFVDLI